MASGSESGGLSAPYRSTSETRQEINSEFEIGSYSERWMSARCMMVYIALQTESSRNTKPEPRWRRYRRCRPKNLSLPKELGPRVGIGGRDTYQCTGPHLHRWTIRQQWRSTAIVAND